VSLSISSSIMAAEGVEQDNSTIAKESYAVGLELGRNIAKNTDVFKEYGIPYDLDILIEGIKDKLKNESTMSEDEVALAINSINKKIKTIDQERKDLEAGTEKAYLDENAKKANITVTKSGLQYEVLEEGKLVSGIKKRPIATSSVSVHYSGKLVNGVEFDSSYKRNLPAKFKVNEVIKGWTEGLQLMSEGSKYRFVIPSELAYGKKGTQ